MNNDAPPRTMSASTHGTSSKRAKKLVSVVLLTGSELKLYVDVKAKLREVFNQVVSHYNLRETEYFGLAFLKEDEYQFVNLNDKVHKHAPKVWRTGQGVDAAGQPLVRLHFRVQFYVDQIVLLREKITRHLYYIQLRQNYLHYKFPRSEERCFQLAAISLQTDFGNYTPSKHSAGYFDPREYFPAWVVDQHSDEYLRHNTPLIHNDLHGMQSCEAQLKFIREASASPAAYNLHFYRLKKRKTDKNYNVWMGVCPNGVNIYETREVFNLEHCFKLLQVWPPYLGFIKVDFSFKKRKTDKNYNVWMGVCPNGVNIYEESVSGFKDIISTFLWPDIGKIHFDKKKFMIRTKGWKEERKFVYFCDSDIKSKYLLTLCRDSHLFEMAVQPKLLEIQHLQANDKRLYQETYIYSDMRDMVSNSRINHRHTLSSKPKDQRYSVVSNTSSNTTSGIVSDRMHVSFDESEDLRFMDMVKPRTTRTASNHSQTSANSLFDGRTTPHQLTPTASSRHHSSNQNLPPPHAPQRSSNQNLPPPHAPERSSNQNLPPSHHSSNQNLPPPHAPQRESAESLSRVTNIPPTSLTHSTHSINTNTPGTNDLVPGQAQINPQIYELKPASYQLIMTNTPTDIIHSLQKHSPGAWIYNANPSTTFEYPPFETQPRYVPDNYVPENYVPENYVPDNYVINNANIDPVYANSYRQHLVQNPVHGANIYTDSASIQQAHKYRSIPAQTYDLTNQTMYTPRCHSPPYANIRQTSIVNQTQPFSKPLSQPQPLSQPLPLSQTLSQSLSQSHAYSPNNPVYIASSTPHIPTAPQPQFALPPLHSLQNLSHPLSRTPSRGNSFQDKTQLSLTPDSLHFTDSGLDIRSPEMFVPTTGWTMEKVSRASGDSGVVTSPDSVYVNIQTMLQGYGLPVTEDAEFLDHTNNDVFVERTVNTQDEYIVNQDYYTQSADSIDGMQGTELETHLTQDLEDLVLQESDSDPSDTTPVAPDSHSLTTNSSISTDTSTVDGTTQPNKQEILHPELEEIRGKSEEFSIPLIAALFNDTSLHVTSTTDKRNSAHCEKDTRRLSMSYPNRTRQIAAIDMTRPFSWHSESFDLDAQLAAQGHLKGEKSAHRSVPQHLYSMPYIKSPLCTRGINVSNDTSGVTSAHNIPVRLHSGGHSDDITCNNNNNLKENIGVA